MSYVVIRKLSVGEDNMLNARNRKNAHQSEFLKFLDNCWESSQSSRFPTDIISQNGPRWAN